MLNTFMRYSLFWLLIITGIVFIILYVYDGLYGDNNLLSFETCLKYAEKDVLGKSLYSGTCARSSYSDKVDLLISSRGISKAGAYEFKFHPLQGKGEACPAVTIAISRHTGEAWIINIEK